MRSTFMNHLSDYGISYGTKEELEFRYQIYLQTDQEINKINSEQDDFVVAHNMFSTLTKDEIHKMKGKHPKFEEVEEEPLDDT